MKTLYLSDLDGTLLTSDGRTGDYTNAVLNDFIAKGNVFSYATARAFETAVGVTEGLCVKAPVAVHNGSMIVDAETGKCVYLADFSREEAERIVAAFRSEGLLPVAYSVTEGRNRFSYCPSFCGDGQRRFLRTRTGNARGSERARTVSKEHDLLSGTVFYFSCIAERETLGRVYAKLKDCFRCFYYCDRSTGDWWLEVMRSDASKASAALRIKRLTGCDRLVCFGDDVNDIPLFRIADESYAPQNAIGAVKELATGVIASNDEDGVAKWIAALV